MKCSGPIVAEIAGAVDVHDAFREEAVDLDEPPGGRGLDELVLEALFLLAGALILHVLDVLVVVAAAHDDARGCRATCQFP